MALIVDYGGLQTAVAEWLWRTGDAGLVARADAFIDLFEKGFKRNTRTLDMEETDTTVITGAAVALPVGFLEMIRLQITGEPLNIPNQVLTYQTPSQAAVRDATQVTTGVTRYYTVISGQVILTPQQWAPVGSTLEMVYYKFVPLNVSPGGTNWLLADHADIYLYGSLMQAAAWVDDKGTVSFWKNGLAEAVADLKTADRRRKVGAGPLIQAPSMAFSTTRTYHRG